MLRHNFYLKIASVFAVAIVNVGCSSGGSSDSAPQNISPAADAGAAQTVSETSTVSLSGSGSDSDGTISTYSWTQSIGTSVTLVGADSANANFVAPNIATDETLVFRLQVTDNDGATASANVDINILDDAAMLITGVRPSFGLPGERVTLELEGADVATSISFNGIDVVPETIEQDSTVIAFVVPSGAETGPIKVVSGSKNSNSIWFDISEIGVLEPTEDKIITNSSGTRVAIDSLLVSLVENSDNRVEADRLAGLVSGEIVGRIPLVNGWQIRLDANSLAELEAIATMLEVEASVEFTVLNWEVNQTSVDWSLDPDHPLQRSRNRVEEGVALYEKRVNTDPGDPVLDPDFPAVQPFFMAIGVSELGIDYNEDDFLGYGANGSSVSGNSAIYSAHRPTGPKRNNHGTNVTGVVAAELGDAGNAGPIWALNESHGGANVSVRGSHWVFGSLSKTNSQLESGAHVINWSWGYLGEGTFDCNSAPATGADPTPSIIMRVVESTLNLFFKNLAADYPNAVIVTASGNSAADAGAPDGTLPAAIVSAQQIVVGAHTSAGIFSSASTTITEDVYAAGSCFPPTGAGDTNVKRASYSNFGNRVDISAAGSIVGFSNDPYTSDTQGTSYAAPLVTATVALMQSINPNLSPSEIKSILRSSSLPIENTVMIYDLDGNTVRPEFFTRPITSEEASGNAEQSEGQGARLNVEGAIKAALDSRGSETLPIDDPHTVTLVSGVDEVTVAISATIPAVGSVFDKVDIMFLVDVSSSYSDDIATFRAKANELIDAFSAAGADVNIGLSSFSDFPVSPYGGATDYAFRLDQPLTSQFADVKSALDALILLGGNDGPESQLEGLYQSSLSSSGWRSGALPVIFLATDASFHNSDVEPDYPGTGYIETLSSLVDRSITVFGLQSGGTISDVLQITGDTGGEAFVLSRNSAEIVAAVQSALSAASSDLDVTLEPFGDFAHLVKSITPSGTAGASPGDSIAGVNPGDTVSFDVVFTRGVFDDNATQTFSFRLRVVANEVAIILEIPVTVILN